MKIKFTIPGEPMGKGRPRFTRNGHTYTPQKTANYETLVKWYFQQEAAKNGFERIDGTVSVGISAVFSVPKSASKKVREQMLSNKIRPSKKPDFDNIGKIVCDALNGLAYDDDKSVVDGRVKKFYGEIPSVTVEIEKI